LDYVVFGIGFGATILVLGLLLRDFGPRLRFRSPRDGGDVLSAEELVGKVSWSRFCNALGSVLALAGAVFLLITIDSMILVVSDDTGLWVMAIAFGVLLVAMLYWTWAYFHRFGSYGILPERVEKQPEAQPATRPRRPAPGPEIRYAGPPVPAALETPDTGDEATAAEPDEATAAVAAQSVGATSPAIPDETEPAVADETAVDPEPTAETRLETPEERLAHAESPMDHGSAEGDLGLAASRPRRPGARAPQPPAKPSPREIIGPPAPTDLDPA
jgi:hypothetical protein